MLSTKLAGSVASVMTTATYVVRVEVFDASNALVFSTKRLLQVSSPASIAYRALSAVNGMLTQLTLGKAAEALQYFTGDAQAVYQPIFAQFGASLPDVASQLGTLKQGSFNQGVAEFVLVRSSANGPRAFPVYLFKAGDGVWRLEAM